MAAKPQGALEGVKVLDLSRHAPGPFCAMLLADFGAGVIQVCDPATLDHLAPAADAYMQLRGSPHDQLGRNKRSLGLDLKSADGQAILHRLVSQADVLITEWRPGTAERLAADYATLSPINPRLVYCAISGYGQTGPQARRAGHDLNYVGRSGVLSLFTDRQGRPIVPANILADFGGGAMAAVAILAALAARTNSGRGQFIDLSLTDAVRYLATDFASLALAGLEQPRGGSWVVTGGVPFYDVYETKDGKFLTVAALEEKFFRRLCDRLGHPHLGDAQWLSERHHEIRETFAATFRAKTQAEWMVLLGEEDVCVGPVVDFTQAVRAANGETGAPRLSLNPASGRSPTAAPCAHSDDLLAEVGLAATEIARLRRAGIVR
jgi:crotonobetainyl-CoA:carnitine CoA-transferase CaiB-like acyl-CoA transferase